MADFRITMKKHTDKKIDPEEFKSAQMDILTELEL